MELNAQERLKIGEVIQVEIGPVAHGGHFVARHNNQVIFVRHGITGEIAKIKITAVTSKIAHADVIEVITPASTRVIPPCSYAGKCGGCDFQHVQIDRQREFKRNIILEQFLRIGKIDLLQMGFDLKVEAIEPLDGLHWRTRMEFAVSNGGRIGFYGARSNDVVEINDCLIADSRMNVSILANRTWKSDARVEVAVSSTGEVSVVRSGRSISGPTQLIEQVGGSSLKISPNAFWQSHKLAPTTLVEAVISRLEIKKSDHICDLYSGVGLFTSAIVNEISDLGFLTLIESDKTAVADARKIFANRMNVKILQGLVAQQLSIVKRADLIVLDPPRTGAGEVVVKQMVKFKPRKIIYVACDPAALARDSKTLLDLGYKLDHISGYDLFPMTQHIECVAGFSPANG
ncbi:MAG: class I SAM-dependent RNA methyltransferase [Actinobacteria bacterium]|nr:class I SAM-dependent RNA methyltransferase [Actinomycetota bacterium]